jgi:hypothetical protein
MEKNEKTLYIDIVTDDVIDECLIEAIEK